MTINEVAKELRDSTDIVALIGEYVRLEERGGNHVGLCPFHADVVPTFNVSAANKFFHCFGCKASGDVIAFVMRLRHVEADQACEMLIERAERRYLDRIIRLRAAIDRIAEADADGVLCE